MEEYKEFVDEAIKSKMPSHYELKSKITFNLRCSDTLFQIEFNAPEYWKYANFGRGPGKFPPRDAISSWITRKRIAPYPLPSGKLPTHNELVFLISRKIAREGFEGSGFLQAGLAEQADYWESRIVTAITQDIELEIKDWLSPLSGTTII